MNSQSGDSSMHLETLKKIKNFLDYTADVSIIGFFNNEEDELYRTYQDTGNRVKQFNDSTFFFFLRRQLFSKMLGPMKLDESPSQN